MLFLLSNGRLFDILHLGWPLERLDSSTKGRGGAMGESAYTSITERTTKLRNIVDKYLFHFVKCSSQYCRSTILAMLCTDHVMDAMVSLLSFHIQMN